MNLENTNKLCAKFPLLYRDLRRFGIECGDGWFDLLWLLSEKIHASVLQEGIRMDMPDAWPSVTIVKQKFGSLRYPISPRNKNIDALVEAAEEQAKKTCEECGAPGVAEANSRRWVKVLCKQCRDKQHALPEKQFPTKKRIHMVERENKK
jgi:hypothetical protein